MKKIKRLNQNPASKAECECGCSFFTQLEAVQVDGLHTVALGNKVTTIGDKFYFLKCIACGDLYEPNILSFSMGDLTTRYGKLLDRLEQ